LSDDALQNPPARRTVKSYSRKRQAQPIDGANIGKPFKEAVINNADLGAGSYSVLRDPYTFAMKIRFEEAYRTDPVIRAAINKKTAFVLGKKLNTIFDLVDSFLAPAEERAAMNILMTDQEYTNAKRVIDRVNRKVNFQQKLKAAFIQAKVYGRSALLVEAPPDGLPVNIKVLSSKLLGQVRIDEKSWQLQQVQYNTNSRGLNDPYNFLEADDIIYFTNCDYHVSPYTIFYGLSDIEPVAHISETNRILNEEDFKEMNYSQWSGFGLLKIPTIRNAAEISSFLNNFKPGRWTAISQDITAEVHEMQKDLASMLTERNENEKLILRQLAVPAAILGFEDIQNFATLQEVLSAWKESEIEEQRSWINSIVEPQWFDKLMCQILNIDDADELKAKIMFAFEDIALENLKDKSLAVIPLYEAGILPADRVLEYLGFDDVADQVKMMQSKKDKINQQLQQQGYDPNAVAQQNRQPGEQPIPVQPAPSSSRGLLNITEDQQQAQGV
jgi:hypothetical protein